jgi:hypothetical protein
MANQFVRIGTGHSTGTVPAGVRAGHYPNTYSPNGFPASQISEVAGLPNCAGIHAWITHRACEPTRGSYSFGPFLDYMDDCAAANVAVSAYVQDRSFGASIKNMPDYYDTEIAGGGIFQKAFGTTPKSWKPGIAARIFAFWTALLNAVKNHPALEFLKYEEGDSGLSTSEWSAAQFDPDDYLQFLKDWVLCCRAAAPNVIIIAPANFLPSGPQDMEEWVQFCFDNKVGMGGPDVFPQPTAQARGPTWTDRVIKGQHYVSGPGSNDADWDNTGIDRRGSMCYMNDVQDPEMGKGYVWTPQQFYEYANSTTVGLGQNHLVWWRKNYTWGNRPGNQQVYWSATGQDPAFSQTNPNMIIKSWLQMGGHPMRTTKPTYWNV